MRSFQQGWRAWVALALIPGMLGAGACSFDTDRPAPYVPPPNVPGPCGDTESLFPKLLALVRDGRVEPLRRVIEARLVPDGPSADPSLRSLLGALIQLAGGLGLERTAATATTALASQALVDLKPLVMVALRFTGGQSDGVPRWPATEAIASLVERCDAEPLLTALEGILRLRSPADGDRRWLAVFGKSVSALIQDPTLEPFLVGFEQDAQRGRPAIIALLDQIITFLADEEFGIDRVRTLLESAVYPAVSDPLRLEIERLVDLLAIATDPQSGVLAPLQGALRCLNRRVEDRHELVGFIYDLLTSDAVDLPTVLSSIDGLVSESESDRLLDFAADLVRVLRQDPEAREPLFALAVVVLRRPEVAQVWPALIDVVDAGVLGELTDGVARLLNRCEQGP